MERLKSQPATGANQLGLIDWSAVPGCIQGALTTAGAVLLNHRRERPLAPHIRFQYVPFAYSGDVYYLQRWSDREWGVSPSQIIFPTEGACSTSLLNNGSLLSLLIKKAVADFYGDFPDNSLLQPSPRRYGDRGRFLLAG